MLNRFPLILNRILILIVLTPFLTHADTVILKDGDRYHGNITFEGEDKIHMEMSIGVIKFNRDEVAAISKDTEEEEEITEEPAEEEKVIPFPRRKRKTPRRRRAPRKRTAPVIVEEPAKEIDDDLKAKERDLEFKERELDLKRRELELRRRELELRKKEGLEEEAEIKEAGEVAPGSGFEEPVEEPDAIEAEPEQQPEPEELPIEEEPDARELPLKEESEEEEESWKVKGYPVKPVIKGSGSERYRTY